MLALEALDSMAGNDEERRKVAAAVTMPAAGMVPAASSVAASGSGMGQYDRGFSTKP